MSRYKFTLEKLVEKLKAENENSVLANYISKYIISLKNKNKNTEKFSFETKDNAIISMEFRDIEIENLVNECIILGMVLKTTKIDSDSWFDTGCETCGYGGGNFTTITVKDLGVSLFED